MKPFFKLILPVLVVSTFLACSSDDGGENTDPNDNPQQGTYEFFISGKLDGEPFSYGVDLDATSSDYLPYVGGELFQDLQNNHCEYSYGGGIYPNFDDALPSASIAFHRFYQGECSGEDETAVFNDLFLTGALSYTTDEAQRGVAFEFSEGMDGNFYSSQYGDQAGSHFTITESQENNQQAGSQTVYRQVISGTFSCTVYNEDDPLDTISVTEGAFKIYVEAFKD